MSRMIRTSEKKNARTGVAARLKEIAVVILVFSAVVPHVSRGQEEDEEAQNWNASVAAKYLSRYTSYGVDLSEDQPALLFEGYIFHSSGLNVGASVISAVGSHSGYQQSSFHLGYIRNVGKVLTISAAYKFHSYKDDTLNVLARIPNSLTLAGVAHVGKINLGGSYNLYFGDGSANFVAFTASTTRECGRLSVEPEVEASFASQTVDASVLPKNRGQAKKQSGGTTTSTVTGLTGLSVQMNLSYPLGRGLSLLFIPVYVYSPSDLSARSSQFLWYAGLTYSVDF